MLRDYGAGERTRRQRYLRPGNGGYHFFFSARQGMKTFFSQAKAFSGLCLMQMGGLQRCFLSRGYHGLARIHERKNGSRTEGCDDVVTRLDPIATHMAVESRVVVVPSLVRIVSTLLRS